jgi:hypothetical protein
MQFGIPLEGLTGRPYYYRPYDRFTDWLDCPANYAFACVNRLIGGWTILYLGEALNIRDRMSGHDRWDDALAVGATHVLGHANSTDEEARKAEERDLIARYNPILNVQHRASCAVGLGGYPAFHSRLGSPGFGLALPTPHGIG